MIGTLLVLFVVLVAAYAVIRVQYRNTKPFVYFFDWVTPIEARIYRVSMTILAARMLTLVSILVSAHDILLPMLTGFDFSPFIPKAYHQYIPFGGIVLGLLFEWLRHLTTQPVDEREVQEEIIVKVEPEKRDVPAAAEEIKAAAKDIAATPLPTAVASFAKEEVAAAVNEKTAIPPPPPPPIATDI